MLKFKRNLTLPFLNKHEFVKLRAKIEKRTNNQK